MKILGFERLVNFFLTYKHDKRVSQESSTPTNVTSTLKMNLALHGIPVLSPVDNVTVSTPPPPPRRSMPFGRSAAPVPAQGLDMLSVVQKTLAQRRQSSSKWQISAHQSSSGSHFQNVDLRTTSSNAGFDMSVSNYSKQRSLRDQRYASFFQYEFMIFELISRSNQSPAFHRPSTNVAARSSIIDSFQRSDIKFNL
jgi:hypothetical protein